MKSIPVTAILALFVPNFTVFAQTVEVPIWPGVPPGSEGSRLQEKYSHRQITDGTDTVQDRAVEGVSRPTVTAYLPDRDKASRVAVLICPGGGFRHLAIDKEGHDIGRWLASQGIAGVVVKYRLPDPEVGLSVQNGSLPDLRRAIRLVRSKANEWKIDPSKIGVMGFSAGGYLSAAAGILFGGGDSDPDDPVGRQSSCPDFITAVYPLVSIDLEADRGSVFVNRILGLSDPDIQLIQRYSLENRVSDLTPPTFLVHASDDRLSPEHSVRFYLALLHVGVPAELHLFSKGGHGFGIRQRGLPVSGWPERWLEWLRSEGIL